MIPAEQRQERYIHRFFEIGVVLKGLNAVIELALGFALLFVNVSGLIEMLARNELVEDPTDFLATHLQAFATSISSQEQLYSSLYLMSHGLIKLALVVGLLRGKLWSYPASLAVLGLFVMYQLLNYLTTHAIGMVLLTLFDLVVMWLIWREYQYVSKRRSV